MNGIRASFIKISQNMAVALVASLLTALPASAVMQPLNDQALGEETGQAAFFTNYIDPNATGNASGLGFFSLGLQGTVSLNANINSLQLGCGGVNGANSCDINLSQVRLTGTTVGPSGTFADSDAQLGNPFLELAIKNPTTLATRQVVGIAFGAESLVGMLSIGQNPNSTPGVVGGKATDETGIGTLSGNLGIAVSNLAIPITTAVGNATGTIKATASQPNLASDAANTGTYYQYLSGNRLTGMTLGQIELNVTGGTFLVAILNGATAYSTVQPENLIDVHNLNASSNSTNGLLLSLNSQSILWPQVGTTGVFSFPTVAGITPNSNGNAITLAQLTAQTGWWLTAPQANIGGTASNPLQTAAVPLSIGGALAALSTGVTLPSLNLLQTPAVNCYGGLKFC